MYWWQLVGFFFPAGALIGVSAAAIGFTAWTLVLPLLLVGFDFSVPNALAVSLVTDCLNGLILAAAFGASGRISLPVGLGLGLLGLLPSVPIVIWVARSLLPKHESLLKGAVPISALITATAFLIRGWVLRSKARKAQQAQDEARVQAERQGQGVGGGGGVATGIQDEESALLGTRDSGLGEEGEKEKSLGSMAVAAVVTAVVAAVVGLVGIGGGMLFAGAIGFGWKVEIRTAVGTGMLVTGVILIGVMAAWAPEVEMDVVWKPAVATAVGSVLGLGLGSYAALKVSKITLNFIIGAVLWVIGVVVIVQGQILKHQH